MPSYADIYVTLEVVTPDSYLCNDGDNQVWIPRSLIDEEETEVYEVGDSGALRVERWFAQQEGLI